MKLTPIMLMIMAGASFSLMKKHILPMLISLEAMMLASIMMMSLLVMSTNKNQSALILICFMVAEGSMALALLVVFTKNKGNELFQGTSW